MATTSSACLVMWFLVPLLFSVVSSFHTNISTNFNPETEVLKVRFDTNKYNYSRYKVEVFKTFQNLCGSQNGSTYHQHVIERNPVSEVEFFGPFTNGSYCVSVTPLKSSGALACVSGCHTEYKMMSIHPAGKLHCNWWLSYLNLDPEINKGSLNLRVSVNVQPPFQSCFSFLNASLWYGVYNECRGHNGGHQVNWTILNLSPRKTDVTVFSDLIPGNYCVRLYSYHSSCKDECDHSSCYGSCQRSSCRGLCDPLYSHVHSLQVLTPEIGYLERTSRNADSFNLLIRILIGTGVSLMVGGMLLGVLVFIKRQKTRWSAYFSQLSPIVQGNDLTLSDIITEAEKKATEIEVILLYFRDFAAHTDVVQALFRFLRDVCGILYVRFHLQEEHDVALDVNNWVDEVEVAKNGRRFIIVESQGAVLQEQARVKRKHVHPIEEDYLDDVFPNAIARLKVGTRGLCDYQTIFVVKFGYTPDDVKLSLVPHRRDRLTDHMFDLYWALLALPKPSTTVYNKFKEEMTRKWSEPLSNDLIPKIRAAEEELRRNPQIVQESIVEEDLFPFRSDASDVYGNGTATDRLLACNESPV